MKATLTYEFDLPDEQDVMRIQQQAGDMHSVLWNFDQQLRSWCKYGHQFADVDDALQGARDKLREMINDRGVTLES